MKYIFSFVFFLSIVFSASAQFSLSGTDAVELKGENDTRIFCLKSLSGAYVEYTTTASSARFFKFSASGRVEVPASDVSQSGNSYTIYNLEDEHGYVVQENGGSDLLAIWIVDYSRHLPVLQSVRVNPVEGNEGDCDGREEKLLIEKEDNPLKYYHPSNQQVSYNFPPRKYKVEYEDIEWDGQKYVEKIGGYTGYAEIGNEASVLSPLRNTHFILKGDEIADKLGLLQQIESDEFEAVQVDPHVVATQVKDDESTDDDSESEDGEEGDSFDDSAPLTILFQGISNEPATVYYTWYIYRGPKENDEVIATFFNEKEMTYTFSEAGDYTVVLEVASSGSICVKESEPITLNISESELQIPNYFSPGDSSESEVPKEFKVKHKSLVKFKCTIFNRWGNKVYQFDDPDQGWDGRYNGKLVNPGVYFYVIEATGSEGKKYKKGGDINILHAR